MNTYRGIVVTGAILKQNSTELMLSIGTEIESLTYKTPYEEKTVAGALVGIQLAPAHPKNPFGEIYDGVATHNYVTDHMGNFRNAEDVFHVDALMIKVSETEHVCVPVKKIVSIGGAIVNPDGTVVVSVADREALVSALADAADGTTVLVNEDVALDAYLNIAGEGNVVLDLNGHEIVREDGTCLYVNSENVVLDITGGIVKGVQAVFGNAGTINIRDGYFESIAPSGTECIYAMGTAQIKIYGGEYHAFVNTEHFAEAQPVCLNILDKDRATASIEVYGGTFYGFDPANNVSEGKGTNFVAEGYKSVEQSEGVFVVVPKDGTEVEEEAVPEEDATETTEETV